MVKALDWGPSFQQWFGKLPIELVNVLTGVCGNIKFRSRKEFPCAISSLLYPFRGCSVVRRSCRKEIQGLFYFYNPATDDNAANEALDFLNSVPNSPSQ